MSGSFYFISNQFYEDFPDRYLMKNKEGVPGSPHDRPCFFAFEDSKNQEIMWMIPISSQIEKFKKEYQKKTEKYGFCNTIYFCEFLNKETAFLIQNMLSASYYITETYKDQRTNQEIKLHPRDEKKIIRCAKDVLKAYNQNKKVIFVNIKEIKEKLEERNSNQASSQK